MTEFKRWPKRAEAARLDVIALALDVQILCVRLENAIKAGDLPEAVRLNTTIYHKALRQQQLLKEVKP